MKLRGRTGVKGFAAGPAKICKTLKIVDPPSFSEPEDIADEIRRLERALAQAAKDLDRMIRSLEKSGRTEEAQIVRFQRVLLVDPEIIEATKARIASNRVSAERAFAQVVGQEISTLLQEDTASEGDDYFARRISDYQDLVNRVIRILQGKKGTSACLHRNCIVISDDLNPTEMIQLLDTKKVRGVALEKGGVTSHATIIASARQVPTVLNLGRKIARIHDGDPVLVNGDLGEVIVNPTPRQSAAFDRMFQNARKELESRESLRGLPATTVDGFTIHLDINLGHPEEIDESTLDQIEGIGVWRTEFLFLGQKMEPGEDHQVNVYEAISKRLPGRSIHIRMLDGGGEKDLPFLPLSHEANPNLGIRGIRLGFRYESVLRRQLRAILRANASGNLSVMVPMVSRIEEVEGVRSLVEQCRKELIQEGHEIREDLPIGIMVEVPSTAMGLDLFMPLVDFLSVGTNDLVQYLLASDRQNEGLADTYSPFYPPIIRLIEDMVRTARRGNKPLSLCGEMASQPLAIPLLIGLGIERLSVAPARLIETKYWIRRLNGSRCREMTKHILQMSRRAEIEQILARFLREKPTPGFLVHSGPGGRSAV
jgi:phosphotransferase system enzyme I (PtsI)